MGKLDLDTIRTECQERFAKDAHWRRMMKCNSGNPQEPAYKAALERYIALETKCRNDESRRSTREEREAELDGGNPDDPVTKILQNRNVCYRVD